ncbi:MAG: hypothetical protein SGJ18_02840 [Pseudomonadota bacterium]|nr:hypothetical protein [Pseudomonadota bacterium]
MRISKLTVFTLALCLTFLSACNKDELRMTDKANIEGEAQAQGQRKAEALRALEMEKDLAIRQRFYQALSGKFDGTIKSTLANGEILELNVRFTFVPSLPPYNSERSRALDEIISDINNLFFTVEVLHWDAKDSAIVFGCVFEKVRPDVAKGTINLAKDGCPSLFSLNIFEPDPSNPKPNLEVVSERLSNEILTGVKDKVDEIKGLRQSTKTTSVFELSLKR